MAGKSAGGRPAARSVFERPVVSRAADHRLARVTESLTLLNRIGLAWVAWTRVLFDGTFAARVQGLSREPGPAETLRLPEVPPAAPKNLDGPTPAALEGALQLLGLLQREGRLLDFIQQDILAFGDAEVGAAARVVHAGCRHALKDHAHIVSVRSEEEGSTVVVDQAQTDRVKLIGNLSGVAPYRGVLRHRGWRVENLRLPHRVGEHDLRIVAPAEVEL